MLIFTTIYLTGCNDSSELSHAMVNGNSNIEFSTTDVEFDELIMLKILSEGNSYKLYVGEDNYSYYYYIYKDNMTVLDEGGFKAGSSPNISMVSDNILELSKGIGSSTIYYKYYDVEKGLASKWYFSVVCANKEYIVYLESNLEGDRKLIIQNLFDEQTFYKEFGSFNFAKATDPVLECKFISDTKIQILYQSGQEYEEITKVIDIL
jgi:hypothetical protein